MVLATRGLNFIFDFCAQFCPCPGIACTHLVDIMLYVKCLQTLIIFIHANILVATGQ